MEAVPKGNQLIIPKNNWKQNGNADIFDVISNEEVPIII